MRRRDRAEEIGDGESGRWQDELYDLLRRNNVTQFAYVPDAGHRILIDRSLADPGVHSVALTTEEEGVALMAGADLGGARGVLLMQSSGAGNCVNMLSLIKGGHFPFLTLLSMRGDFGEGNPWQFPMGQAVEPVLRAMGVICLRVEQPGGGGPDRRRRDDDGVSGRQRGGRAADPETARRQGVLREIPRWRMTTRKGSIWRRRSPPASSSTAATAVPALIGRHEDFLFVTGLAGTARDIAALTKDGAHIYTMAGAMGGACMIGLGLALARPRQARAGRDRRRRIVDECRCARDDRGAEPGQSRDPGRR